MTGHWNYRRVKYTHVPKKKTSKTPHYVLFGITEVYYDKNGKANGYVDLKEINLLNHHDEAKNVEEEYLLIKGAFDSPILDLDNFPNEFIH